MRQKHLESALSQIQREFPEPDVTLEQYPTSPHLAASVVLMAAEYGDLGPGRTALDLGTGTGMLAIAAALIETDHVIAVDCDAQALGVALENAEIAEVEDQISFVQDRVRNLSNGTGGEERTDNRRQHGSDRNQQRGGRKGRGGGGRHARKHQQQQRRSTPQARQLILADDDGLALRSNCVDTCLINPPFGTKANAGMDLRFLRTGTRLARRAVYSFHKTSTREFLVRQVESWGMQIQVIAEMKFDLANTYKFHKEKSKDVHVDLIRVFVSSEDNDENGNRESLVDAEQVIGGSDGGADDEE